MQPGTRGPAGLPTHEFHNASLENLPSDTRCAWRVLPGHGLHGRRDGIVVANLVASSCHLRDTGANRRTTRFMEIARKRKRGASPAARQSTNNTL